MRLGDIANEGAAANGRPLDGIRILAAEQMQALPYATQLLARLGAEVVKVEPIGGESGRGALPAMIDPAGNQVGATFLRNNFNKKTISLNLKDPAAKEIFIELAGHFDVVAENNKAGAMDRLGLGYDTLSARWPELIYLSISGFGNTGDSPYRNWPAYAMIPEAMSGIYEHTRSGNDPPRVAPAGALGDIGSALYGVIGILAALAHRQHTGRGQYIDIAMLDAMVAMTDVVSNFWSLGRRPGDEPPLIMHGFQASDGWFVMQVGREHQFVRLARLIGCDEWLTDDRLATRPGWVEHLETIIRPAVEGWASTKSKLEVCELLGEAGIAAGPCNSAPEIIADPHVAARSMLVEMSRTDDVNEPVLVPGNPVKMSAVAEGPETRVPWVGEHTDEVLSDELGFDADTLAELRSTGVIG